LFHSTIKILQNVHFVNIFARLKYIPERRNVLFSSVCVDFSVYSVQELFIYSEPNSIYINCQCVFNTILYYII